MNWYKFAVKEQFVKTINDAMEQDPEQLGLNDIFGDKLRKIVPFKSPMASEVLEQLNNRGYTVDLNNQTATKVVQTQQGQKTRTSR